jgi:hypothetical protein
MNQKYLLLILLQNFSVQDLEGNHINDVKASVIVTNGQRLFKFQNITTTDGDFNVEYIFPDDGTHQVITRIDTKTTIIPASFTVICSSPISSQYFESISSPT